MLKLSVWLLGWGLMWGCGSSASDEPMPVTLSGAVQKGPFILGSTVNISLLDAGLNPTGQIFSVQTISNLGQFSVDFSASGQVALEGNGFYYNEVTGNLSAAPLTLRALYDIQMAGTQNAYINLITHLSFQRVKQLVGSGMTTATATTQAESELQTGLGIGTAGFMVPQRGIDLNILGGDSDGNAYLFALSAVVVQAAVDKAAAKSVSIDATLQELLNTTALDLSDDGQLQAPLQQAYLDAQRHVDVDVTVAAMRARLLELGSSATVPDLGRVLDSDADGVVNSLDNCPYAENANQAPIPDGLCKFAVRSFPSPMSTGGLTLVPADLAGNKIYSVFASISSDIFGPRSYSLFKGDGTGTLAMPTTLTLSTPTGASTDNHCCGLILRDMNNDQKDDVLRVDSGGWMAVYPGDGLGGFGAPQPINKLPPLPPDMIAGQPFTTLDRFAVGDFNKDGLMDIIGSFMGTLVLVTQQPGGAWGAPAAIRSLPTSLNLMVAADFDKDTNMDILYLDSYLQGAHLYFGKGNGSGGFTFTNPTNLPPPQASTDPMTVGDFNNDSNLDVLFLAYPTSGPLRLPAWWFSAGDGLGNFTAPMVTSIKSTRPPIVGNFAGTGQSFVLTSTTDQSLQLWTYRNGGFSAGPERPFIHFGTSFACDMDKDGKLDLVGSIPGSAAGSNLLTIALSR